MTLVIAACGQGSPAGAPPTPSTRATDIASPAPVTTTATVPTTTTTTVDPGLLPPASDEPAVGPELEGRMRILWQAIAGDRPDVALTLYFPRTAYQRMKTGLLRDPAADYANRLLAFYRLDLGAYHAVLGPQAAGAGLLQVLVGPADAAWIAPGHCENLIGYWHLPGVRLVYQEGGLTRSFAVASLISWRGEWYVVHLGPNPHPQGVGSVDQPATGPGTPGPPGGC
jgi:hypothetical protein